jgi:acyl-CoA reductase-like NAD-dependent aldehyde dehydrogenase
MVFPEAGFSDELIAVRAAELYYEENKTQDEIGTILRITRWKVGRLLQAAREHGIIRIDTWVWFAGFADKYAQIVGNGNPVSGPYFNLSVPEPTGVVVALATQEPKGHSLLGFTAVVAPILVSGNSVVVLTHHSQPRSALSLAEVLATSDVPGGVVNILSGNPDDIMPWLASHADVNALDLAGGSEGDWVAWQKTAAGTSKRVVSPVRGVPTRSLDRITSFTETKTIWHTKAIG